MDHAEEIRRLRQDNARLCEDVYRLRRAIALIATDHRSPAGQPSKIDRIDAAFGGILDRLSALEGDAQPAESRPLRWPGPWTEGDDGCWGRDWARGDQAVFAYRSHNGAVYLPDVCGGTEIDANDAHPVNAAACRKFDAILATVCDGPDPHPYPAKLLEAK